MSDSTTRCWDHADCPRDDCRGGLQQQDRVNVMCLTCEGVWTHYIIDGEHRLVDDTGATVARKSRVVTDGGTEQRQVQELKERVAELESVINRELGYNLGQLPPEPQTVDCDCGESFEVNIVNGLVCPECSRTHGAGVESGGDADD